MNTEELAAKEAEKIKQEAELNAKLEAQFKVEHGAIAHITNVDEDGNTHHLWLKKPNRMAVGASLATIESDVVTGCEIIFNSSVIKEISDVEYFQQDEVFYGLIAPLQRLVSVKKSTFTTL